MPPKQRITKEIILETARNIVKNHGIDSINSRNIAKEIGCSTQPVFSQFPTMEELRQAVHDYCCTIFENEVLIDKEAVDFMKRSYLKVIHLARDDKHIFELIYLSDYCLGSKFIQNRMNYDSNKQILIQLMNQYELNEEEGKDILQRSSLLIQGIATLMATTNVSYSDDDVCRIVEQTICDMVNGIKLNK